MVDKQGGGLNMSQKTRNRIAKAIETLRNIKAAHTRETSEAPRHSNAQDIAACLDSAIAACEAALICTAGFDDHKGLVKTISKVQHAIGTVRPFLAAKPKGFQPTWSEDAK